MCKHTERRVTEEVDRAVEEVADYLISHYNGLLTQETWQTNDHVKDLKDFG
jgi:hypothetical protein